MAISSFTTVFKMPKEALHEIAQSIGKSHKTFTLSEEEKESLATSGQRFQQWLESEKEHR